jgi:hypothetical protein
MTVEEFENLKPGDEIFVYSYMNKQVISVIVTNLNYSDISNVIIVETNYNDYYLGGRHRLHFSEKECKIQHIKLLMRNKTDISEHKEFIEQNVEYFI